MEIGLYRNDDDYVYFSVVTEEECYYTSRQIAKLFNLTIEQYNKILIKKVIQHDRYLIAPDSNRSVFSKDLAFNLLYESLETYIERFEEIFEPYIILLKLGGGV